jgi:hypothetical protein
MTPGRTHGRYSETTLSVAATFSANTFGVMNCAFFDLRSASVTPRATEHLPQTKMGTRWATTPSTISLSDGMATGMTALITLSFIR